MVKVQARAIKPNESVFKEKTQESWSLGILRSKGDFFHAIVCVCSGSIL